MLDNGLASRFIYCYNQIDNALKVQGDAKASMSYTELIRRASRSNPFIKKYEDVLIDYGRLRNAIVHSSNENHIIAEPHLDVVENYEKLAKIICTPPLAIDSIGRKDVMILQHTATIREVVEFMYKANHSNFPIYKDGMLIGVANAKRIIKHLGKIIYEKNDLEKYISTTTIEQVTKAIQEDNYYTVVDANVTLDKVVQLFTENRKLVLIIITKSGSLLENPIGLISTGDLLAINKVLDDYQ